MVFPGELTGREQRKKMMGEWSKQKEEQIKGEHCAVPFPPIIPGFTQILFLSC